MTRNLIRIMPAQGLNHSPAPRVQIMIATKDSFEPHSSEQLPASKKVFVAGTIHADVRVPMREIEVSPTKSYTGAVTPNDPVRVYDCSGPWGDPAFTGTSDEGLPALRAKWIAARKDVAEYDGREVKPQDNGYLSDKHAEFASQAERNRLLEFPGLRRKPLRANAGHPQSAPPIDPARQRPPADFLRGGRPWE